MFKKFGETAVTQATSWKCRRVFTNNLTTGSKLSATVPAVDKSRTSSPPSTSTKKHKKPFMKGIFAGGFDQELLTYPEVVQSSQLAEVRRNSQTLKEGLQKIGDGSTSSIREKLQFLARSGVHVKEENQSSRFLFQCESLDLSPDLALSLEIQHSYVIQLISKYGTEEAKEKYLSKLMSGELVGACALADKGVCGSDLSTMKSIAQLDSESTYVLTSEKQWVTNAEFADIFIVFVLCQNPSHVGRPDFSAFIVDRNSNDVKIDKINTVGLKNLGIANVKFNRAIVAQENMLFDLAEEYSMAEEIMSGCTNFVFASILGVLKRMISDMVSSVVPKVQTSAFLKDCELVQKAITKASMAAYALESMLYFKTGLDDSFAIETKLESAIIKLFCKDDCIRAMEECMSILGAQAYDNSLHYSSLVEDCKGMLNSFSTTNTNKLYIGLEGISYAGRHIGETITKIRRPYDNPGFIFKKFFAYRKHEVDNPDLTLQLFLQLHPSLKSVANLLEYCVLRFHYAIEQILVRHGTEIVDRQLELERLAIVACRILAMTSVCARSSRSICTGIKFSEHEIQHAVMYCVDSHEFVKQHVNDVIKGPMQTSDLNLLRNSAQTITDKSYIFEHPLVRNIE